MGLIGTEIIRGRNARERRDRDAKKILKQIRKQLLKIAWLRREVEAYKLEQKKRQHHDDWAQLMKAGGTVRTDEDDPDSAVLVDYSDTRMTSQRGVTPNIIRPFGLGRRKR